MGATFTSHIAAPAAKGSRVLRPALALKRSDVPLALPPVIHNDLDCIEAARRGPGARGGLGFRGNRARE